MSARSTSLYAVILLTAMALIPSAASAVSLLAYYEFEGNYNDSTTNGNNAAPGQNPTEVSIVAGGFRGQGADINDPAGSGGGNTGGSINIPINANPNESPEISFGGWVNLETNAGFPGFMAIDNGGWDRGIHLAGNSWEIASGGTTNVVVGAAPTGVWQYVVGTFSKPTNTATLYIGDNSAVQSTLSGSRADAGNNPGEVVIEIGRYDNQDLDARVDDIFVFDGALNAHQANAIRNLRLSGLDFSPADAAQVFDLFDTSSSGRVRSINWTPAAGLSAANPGEVFDLGGGNWAIVLDGAGNGLTGTTVFEVVDDTGATGEDTVLTMVDPGSTTSLLANDSGVGLTVSAFQPTSAQGASVNVNPDGTFSYDPTAAPALQALLSGETVDDTFTYAAREGTAPPALGGVTSDLALWLDASDIDGDGSPDSIADGALINTWADKSGNGLDATLTRSDPNYKASATPTGASAVNFDGDDQLRTPNLQTVLNDADGSYSIITVARYTGGQNGRVITSDHNWLFGFWSNSAERWYAQGWIHQGGDSSSNWQVHSGLMDGVPADPQADFYKNGNPLVINNTGSDNNFVNYAPRALHLGGWNANGEYSRAEVSEVIVYDRLLSDAERIAVEGYLNDKYFGVTATVTITVSGVDDPPVATDDDICIDEDGAGATEFTSLLDLNLLATGDYSVTADGETFDARVDHDGTHGWLLVGRGRQGWAWSDAGVGLANDVNDDLGTPAAFAPKYFRSAIINDLITGAGVDLTEVEIRLKRAGDPAGTTYQEDRWRPTTQTTWDWVFPDPSRMDVVHEIVSGPFGTQGPHAANTHDEGANNSQRVFTWAWGGHANEQGFSYGQGITNGSNAATSFLWEAGNEQHAIPYTEVYIRLPSAPLPQTLLDNDSDLDSTIFVSSVDDTGVLGILNVPTGYPAGDGSFTYDPNGQFESLNVGETATETFDYTITEITVSDGLFDVQVVNTIGPDPGNSTPNWLAVFNALDGGAGPTGSVAGFNVQNNTSDTESVFDYAGGGGNYPVNTAIGTIAGDGPGGGPGPFAPAGTGGSNYAIRAQTFLRFANAGTYTIGMGSDDGRRIELTEAAPGSAPGYSGFLSRHQQVNGTFAPGDTVIGLSGGTGHNWSLGVFDVAAGDILALDAFYYEGGGGDSGEIALALGTQTGFNTGPFDLLEDGVHGVAIGTDASLLANPVLGTSATATATITIKGVNDAPTVTGSGIPDQCIFTSNPTIDVPLFPHFEDVDNDDDELTYTVTMNNNGTLIQTSTISSLDGILTLDTPCTLKGTADITITVEDPGGLSVSDTFTVEVKDDVPPFFTGIKDKVYSVAAGTNADASLHFAGIAAADKVDGPIGHTCTLGNGDPLPAGNLFPVGVHPIKCTASDSSTNTTTVTFNIIVLEIQSTPGVRMFDLVTLRGDAVAGAGIPGGAELRDVQRAFLNNSNDILYAATLANAGTNNAAVFAGTLAAQSAIAVKNTASGVGDYGNFSNLALNDAAHAAFESRISVNPGHFLDAGGGPLASARKNLAAPTGGGELFGTLQKPALASGGELLTRANLVLGSGAGVTIGDDTVITSSAGSVLAREGDASSVATTAYDQLHPRIVASEDNNHYAFSAFLLEDAGFDPIDNTGLFTGTVGGGLPALVARENDLAPGIAGATLKQFLGEAVNSSGELALRCNLAGTGVNSTNNEALYTNTGGSLVLVAREGDVAPCLPNNLVAFKRFETFYMGDDGSVCFRAFLKNATTTPAIHSGNDGSVWRWKDGTLHLVAREGDMANNTDGAVIRTIDGFSCSGAGGITYWTSFVPGLGDSVTSNNLGAYLDRGVADAAPELILRRSDTFDLGGGDIRTVVGIKLSTEENSGGGTGGYGRTINDAGNVLLNLRLSGNQSGIFVLSP